MRRTTSLQFDNPIQRIRANGPIFRLILSNFEQTLLERPSVEYVEIKALDACCELAFIKAGTYELKSSVA
jgi:hypothetical protein